MRSGADRHAAPRGEGRGDMASAGGDYALLDSGGLRKLERFGAVTVVRPAPNAFWRPRVAPRAWDAAAGEFVRDSSGGGAWSWRSPPPAEWRVRLQGLSLLVKPTDFGHMGVFPEQAANWAWLAETVAAAPARPRVLNLFAYSGAASAAMAAAGAETTHLDASRGMLEWAKANAAANAPGAAIRFIVDDAMKFLAREARRGCRYDGIVLDPPSFGRGPRGEVWKIERDIGGLLDQCAALLEDEPLLMLLTCHSAGFTPCVLARLLAERLPARPVLLDAGEMLVPETGGRLLPAGAFARWRAAGATPSAPPRRSRLNQPAEASAEAPA